MERKPAIQEERRGELQLKMVQITGKDKSRSARINQTNPLLRRRHLIWRNLTLT